MTTTAPQSVSIRSAERADLLSILRIEQASFPQPWPFQAFEGFLGEPGFLVAVGESAGAATPNGGAGGGATDEVGWGAVNEAGRGADGDVRGYVVADVVTDYGRTIGHVKDLAVAPDWRGRGIGSRLLDRALSVVAAGGARRAKLEVRVDNGAARELYDAFGFSPNHVVPGYYEDGEDALLLVADLKERAAAGDR